MAEAELTLDFLEPRQREYLCKQAEKDGCTPAEILRRMVEREMRSSDKEQPGRERIMRLAGMISDDEVSGENFDDYLYGWGYDD